MGPPYFTAAVNARAHLEAINWPDIANGLNWVLGLGVFGALVSAALTSIREKRARDRNRRSTVASQFINMSVQTLSSRLRPNDSADGPGDALLVYAHQMLHMELGGRRNSRIRTYLDDEVKRIRFGQPAPSIDETVGGVAPLIATWVQKPRRARKLIKKT